MTIWNTAAYANGELLSTRYAPENVSARMARRYDGAVGELNRWVDDIREATGESIPYVDPDAAANGVRILMLFQDPSGAAEGESGFISKHNNDPTAHNYYDATTVAGVPYDIALNWNVVPWWSTNNPAHPDRTVSKEAPRAAPYLSDFIKRLGEPPRVIVLSGGKAQSAWNRIKRQLDPSVIEGTQILPCPHPSPLVYSRVDKASGRLNRDLIVDCFREAVELSR
ncbi:uracil-DNA glycosylase family protein [Gordonia sp. MP11Mi]|uniref:Uracil-DNA glycosylase-like domain-containing protein n=1 Tax=Gordonia sp. MP11Mi TaxID=3022769 RepID=A0AA97GT58_9ACTN